MARKKTREELESEIARLRATEEAFYAVLSTPNARRALLIDKRVVRLESGEGDTLRSVEIVGIDRAAGGVVIAIDGLPCAPQYLCDWCRRIEAQGNIADPYRLDVAREARRAQADAGNARPLPPMSRVTIEDYDRLGRDGK